MSTYRAKSVTRLRVKRKGPAGHAVATQAPPIMEEIQPGLWVCIDPRYIVPAQGDTRGVQEWANRFETARRRIHQIEIASLMGR